MVSEVAEQTGVVAPSRSVSAAAERAGPRRAILAAVAAPAAVALGSGFFLLVTWLAFARHASFNTGRFDLEIYTQVVWNTGQGRPFETTLLKTNLVHLAEHLALVLVPLSWLYRLLPDPKLLIGIQQLALALLGWPLFLWARYALGSAPQALLVLACFYASPALAGIALDDFHALPLATLPLALGYWLVLVGRPGQGAALALVALLMEEEAALFVAGLGALVFFGMPGFKLSGVGLPSQAAQPRRALGALVGGLAVVWLAAAVFVVMPRFHDPRTLELVDGNRTIGHFAELRQNPAAAVGRLFGDRGADAVVWALLPTGGLALLAPGTLLVAAPPFTALLLQDRDDTFSRHWAAPLLVAVWTSTVAGLARLRRGRPRQLGLGLLVVGTVLAFRLVSPLPGGANFDPDALGDDERTELLARAVARVPAQGVVVASANVVAHLANRPEAYVFPIDSHYAEALGWRKKRPDVYVLDLYDDLTNRAMVSERLNPLNANREDRPYHIWAAGRKVLVLSDQVDEPSVPLDARYGDRMLLKGYDLLAGPNGARLVLHWERYAEMRGRYDRDLTVLDARGNRLLYQEDMPLSSVYGSNKWRSGQTILDEIELPASTGPLTIRVGWLAEEKRRGFRLADGSETFDLVVDPDR